MSSKVLAATLLLLAPLLAQQTRDLKVEKEPAKTPPEPAAVQIPRGYAVLIGIASYPTLPPKNQLHFPERDAEAMYSILISPEGGNSHAENVHRLIGSQVTLADRRNQNTHQTPPA